MLCAELGFTIKWSRCRKLLKKQMSGMRNLLRPFMATLIPQLISNRFLYTTLNVSERRPPLDYNQLGYKAVSLNSPTFSPDMVIREPIPIPYARLANTRSLYSKLLSLLIPVILLFSGVS